MMKIVVIGGSGLIGSNIVNRLRLDGHETVAASPSTGVNTLTGQGLAEAHPGMETEWQGHDRLQAGCDHEIPAEDKSLLVRQTCR